MQLPKIQCHFRFEEVTCFPNFPDFLRNLDKHAYKGLARDVIVQCQTDINFPRTDDFFVVYEHFGQTAYSYGDEEGAHMIGVLGLFWNEWLKIMREDEPIRGHEARTAKRAIAEGYKAKVLEMRKSVAMA